jgi:spore maturation protein CgeB
MKLSLKPRIVCIADPSFSNPYPSPLAGIPNALKAVGLEVHCLNAATATFDSFRQEIDVFKPDLLFGLIQYPEQVAKIAGFLDEYHPVAAINWNLEDPNGIITGRNLEYNLLELSSSFDMWFGIDSRMVPFWHTKAAYMPPGFDESIFRDDNVERCYDVSYIGQLGPPKITEMYWPYMKELAVYGRKAMLCIDRPMGVPLLPRSLERFLRSKKRRRFLQKLPIWRCAWTNPQDERAKSLIINQSKIHFGMSRVRGDWEDAVRDLLPDYRLDKHGFFYQLKARLFQAVGAGAMVLNEYTPELEDLFDIGKEMVAFEFGNLEELRDKLSWYLSHDTERRRIARAGYERGRKQHTFTARIQQILDFVRKTL